MTVERRSLSVGRVQSLERGEMFTHPIISLLERLSPQIDMVKQQFSDEFAEGEQLFIQKHYGFLADAVEELEDFDLDTMDMVGIWAKATKVFSLYERYAFARILIDVYSMQGIDNSAWRGFPRRHIEGQRFPEADLLDTEGLLHIRKRHEDIWEYVAEIDEYFADPSHEDNQLLFQVRENFATALQSAYMDIDIALNDWEYVPPSFREKTDN